MKRLQHLPGRDLAAVFMARHRLFRTYLCESLVPFAVIGDLFLHRLGEGLDNAGGVANKPDVGLYRLVNLRRVQINVDDLRVGGEALAVSRRAVAEARTDGDDDVRPHQRAVRYRVAVHTGHAERKTARMRLGEGSLAKQRCSDRYFVFEREVGKQLRGS